MLEFSDTDYKNWEYYAQENRGQVESVHNGTRMFKQEPSKNAEHRIRNNSGR